MRVNVALESIYSVNVRKCKRDIRFELRWKFNRDRNLRPVIVGWQSLGYG